MVLLAFGAKLRPLGLPGCAKECLETSGAVFASSAGLQHQHLALTPLVFLVTSWAVLIVVARCLPPGLLKDLAGFLPACVTLIRRLRRDPRVPRRARLAVAIAGLWVISPIDLIPEFLPVIGPLDDVVVVALALRFAARRVPPEVLFEAWPAEPRLLERLIGRAAPWAGE